MSDIPRTTHQAYTATAVPGSNAGTTRPARVVPALFASRLEWERNQLRAALAEVLEGAIPHKRDFLFTAYARKLAERALADTKAPEDEA